MKTEAMGCQLSISSRYPFSFGADFKLYFPVINLHLVFNKLSYG